MELLESIKDKIIAKLTITDGEGLDLTCNLTSNKQAELFIEEMALTYLGSEYISQRANMLKRLTCSYQGRARTDMVEIGKTPELRVNNSAGIEDR